MGRAEAAKKKRDTGHRISHKTGLPIRTFLQDHRRVVWRSLPVSGAATNTALHNGDDLFNGSGTVLFQPLRHNSHKTSNIKGRHIGPLLLRNVKAFQNRGEHMPEQSIIGFLYLQGGAVFYGSFEKIFVHLHILQIRH